MLCSKYGCTCDDVVDPLHLTLDQALARFAAQYLPGRNLAARTRVEYLADLTQALSYIEEGASTGSPT